MLHLTMAGLSLENKHRRLQVSVAVVHVDESAILPHDSRRTEAEIQEWLLTHQLDCYFVPLADSLSSSQEREIVKNRRTDTLSDLTDNDKKLTETLSSLTSASSKEELLRRLKLQLISGVAAAEGFHAVFLGSSGTRLSMQLITDVAQGRGCQVNLEAVS